MINLDRVLLVAILKFNGVVDANVSLTMKGTRYSLCFNIEEVLGPNTFIIKFLYVCMDLEETHFIFFINIPYVFMDLEVSIKKKNL